MYEKFNIVSHPLCIYRTTSAFLQTKTPSELLMNMYIIFVKHTRIHTIILQHFQLNSRLHKKRITYVYLNNFCKLSYL